MGCNCKRVESAEELTNTVNNAAKERLSFALKVKTVFGFFVLQTAIMYSSIWNFMWHDRLEPTVPRKLIRLLFRRSNGQTL